MLLIVVYAVRFVQIFSWYSHNIALKCREVILSCSAELKWWGNSIVYCILCFYLSNMIKLAYIGWHFWYSRIFYVILHIMQRYAETSKQRLDLAILVFFQNFRKSYVGDQAIHSSKVHSWNLFAIIPKYKASYFISYWVFNPFIPLQQLYTKLAELLGLHDHMLILNLIVGKIATNLKFYSEVIVIVDFLWFFDERDIISLLFIRVMKLSVKH